MSKYPVLCVLTVALLAGDIGVAVRKDIAGINYTYPVDRLRSRMLSVFSGGSSRILRVLLEKPQPWSLTEIAKEISHETQRISSERGGVQIDFTISLGGISKALASLEEQLWIRRRNGTVLVPEPRRLLMQWSEKYKERYR